MKKKKRRYRNNNGKYQKRWNKFYEMPLREDWTAETRPGELFLAAEHLYKNWYDEGVWIGQNTYSEIRWTGCINAWNFLLQFPDYDMSQFALNIYNAADNDEEYEQRLEEMMDAVLEYVAKAKPVPNDMDFRDHRYADESKFNFVDDEEEDEE